MVTRKMSLKAAMEMLQNAGKAEMAEKLGEMLAEMPCAHWTRASIEDAFLDWFWAHGRLPSTRALDNMPGLPCHGTIRKCLGVPYAQFAEAFLRRWGDLLHLPGYGWTSAEALRTLFLREYERLRPTSPARYNARRKEGTPSALAIARALTLEGTWEALLAHLGLTRYYPRRAATAPRGQACAAAADSPAQRLERYLECFREHEARVEAALVRADARARTQPAAKRTPRGTFDGVYETDFSIGARTSEKR